MITGTGYRENNTRRPDFRAGVVNHQLRARGNVGWGTEKLTDKKKSVLEYSKLLYKIQENDCNGKNGSYAYCQN